MEMELVIDLHSIGFKFFVKMIGIKGFSNPNYWFQDWVGGSIKKQKVIIGIGIKLKDPREIENETTLILTHLLT